MYSAIIRLYTSVKIFLVNINFYKTHHLLFYDNQICGMYINSLGQRSSSKLKTYITIFYISTFVTHLKNVGDITLNDINLIWLDKEFNTLKYIYVLCQFILGFILIY